jgi:hypothetical protein
MLSWPVSNAGKAPPWLLIAAMVVRGARNQAIAALVDQPALALLPLTVLAALGGVGWLTYDALSGLLGGDFGPALHGALARVVGIAWLSAFAGMMLLASSQMRRAEADEALLVAPVPPGAVLLGRLLPAAAIMAALQAALLLPGVLAFVGVLSLGWGVLLAALCAVLIAGAILAALAASRLLIVLAGAVEPRLGGTLALAARVTLGLASIGGVAWLALQVPGDLQTEWAIRAPAHAVAAAVVGARTGLLTPLGAALVSLALYAAAVVLLVRVAFSLPAPPRGSVGQWRPLRELSYPRSVALAVAVMDAKQVARERTLLAHGILVVLAIGVLGILVRSGDPAMLATYQALSQEPALYLLALYPLVARGRDLGHEAVLRSAPLRASEYLLGKLLLNGGLVFGFGLLGAGLANWAVGGVGFAGPREVAQFAVYSALLSSLALFCGLVTRCKLQALGSQFSGMAVFTVAALAVAAAVALPGQVDLQPFAREIVQLGLMGCLAVGLFGAAVGLETWRARRGK